jgi:elongation factor G
MLLLLEPIRNGGCTPEENMGDIVGDINRRRGQVNDAWVIERCKTIGRCAIIRNVGYVTTLGRFHLVEQHLLWNFHAETPSNISEAVIKKSKGSAIFKKMSQKIRIKLKSYDHMLVDSLLRRL